MKNIKSAIYAALMTIAVICIPGCSNEYDDVAPGTASMTSTISSRKTKIRTPFLKAGVTSSTTLIPASAFSFRSLTIKVI